MIKRKNFLITTEDRIKRTPSMESGRWSGSRGNSWCSPSTAYSKQILKQYSVDSILYVDGEPDFSPLSHSTVQLGNMTENRYSHGVQQRIPQNDLTNAADLFTKYEDVGNFAQADLLTAEKWSLQQKDGHSWTISDVKHYRDTNNLTWHERGYEKTMDMIPREINRDFSHMGGVAESKSIHAYIDDYETRFSSEEPYLDDAYYETLSNEESTKLELHSLENNQPFYPSEEDSYKLNSYSMESLLLTKPEGQSHSQDDSFNMDMEDISKYNSSSHQENLETRPVFQYPPHNGFEPDATQKEIDRSSPSTAVGIENAMGEDYDFSEDMSQLLYPKEYLDNQEQINEQVEQYDPDTIEVQPGTQFKRYGEPTGRFVTDVETPFEQISLPEEMKNSPEHYYQVNKPFLAQEGYAAPAFGQEGGGRQYLTEDSLENLIDDGYLIEIAPPAYSPNEENTHSEVAAQQNNSINAIPQAQEEIEKTSPAMEMDL